MRCHACDVSMPGINQHHVLPRHAGGHDGPLAPLCASCHTAVHQAERRLLRGDPPDEAVAHLPPDARERALALAHVAHMAGIVGGSHQNPRLSVHLDDPRYLRALDEYRLQRGFSSREACVNAMLRELALRLGLLSDAPREIPGKSKKIRDFRGPGPRGPRTIPSRGR